MNTIVVVVLVIGSLAFIVLVGYFSLRRRRKPDLWECPPVPPPPAGEYPPPTAPAPRPRPAPPPPAPIIHFTTYHPRGMKPDVWYRFLVYAHLPSAFGEVQADSRTRLGHQARDYGKGRGQATQFINRGAEIVVVPDLPGCRFNPPRASVLWLEDWHRAEFRMQATPNTPGFEPGTAVNGRVAFYVGPILVAETPIWTYIWAESDDEAALEDPNVRTTSEPYQAIFVSYSHKDTAIIEQLEKAYVVLGMQYLRDVRMLRSGEKWYPALLQMIEVADIFQLCWSNNAKQSPYVRQEWRHALKQERPSFIRPVYWEKPMPPPPPELSDIHFAYLELTSHP
jgi:hypothetical protein